LTRYYRRFIEELSTIAIPMTRMTRRKTKWEWIDECEQSFQELKKRLTTTLVLALPDWRICSL
jgi:hypothetical protein